MYETIKRFFPSWGWGGVVGVGVSINGLFSSGAKIECLNCSLKRIRIESVI